MANEPRSAMPKPSNLTHLLPLPTSLVLAYLLDYSGSLLADYAGTTFNFRAAIWGQVGIALFFGLLAISLTWFLFVATKPKRWIFALYMLVGLIGVFNFPLTSLGIELFFGLLPQSYGRFLYLAPSSYLGLTSVFFSWLGLFGLFRNRQSNAN